MASDKKYPVVIKRDAAGNENAALDTAILMAIAAEPAFKDKKYREIAQEYIRRTAAEDPDFDQEFEVDPQRGVFMGAKLPQGTTEAERKRIVDELRAKGHDAEIMEMQEVDN